MDAGQLDNLRKNMPNGGPNRNLPTYYIQLEAFQQYPCQEDSQDEKKNNQVLRPVVQFRGAKNKSSEKKKHYGYYGQEANEV